MYFCSLAILNQMFRFGAHYTVWKLRDFSLMQCLQKFRESDGFRNKLLKSWFDEIFGEREFLVFPHCEHSDRIPICHKKFVKACNNLWFHEIFSKEKLNIFIKRCKKMNSIWNMHSEFRFRQMKSSIINLGPRKILIFNSKNIQKIGGSRMSAVREGPRKILIAKLELNYL